MAAGDASSVARFAAGTLGLDPDAPADQIRSALLRRLLDEDYWPGPNSHEAAMALSGRPEAHAPRIAEAAARAEVEAFVAEYFDLPIEERCRRWSSLSRTCASREHLLHRLKALEAGLSVQRRGMPHESPLVDRLIAESLELSLLRPAPRAARRRELVESLRSDPAIRKRDLSRAIRAIRKASPAVFELAPDFLADLKRPRRITLRHRFARDRFRFRRLINARPRLFGGIALAIVFGPGLILLVINPDHNPPTSSARTSGDPAALIRKLNDSKGARPSEAFIRFFQDQFKIPIRRELAKFGKTLDDARLERIVRTLPTEGITGGLATMMLTGTWTRAIHDRYAATLKGELGRAGLGLSELQLDAIARGSIPRPPGSSAESIPQVPY